MNPERVCAREGCSESFIPKRKNQLYHHSSCGQIVANRRRNGGRVAPGAPSDEVLIKELQSRGFKVELPEPVRKVIKLAPLSTKTYRLGVVSDTHLGSKFQQITYLHEAYDRFHKEGVEVVLHAGDLVHGSDRMHRDMLYELHVHGAHAQTAYAVENYPRVNGIKTYIIDGNHDLSFKKDGGAEVVQDFADKRDDVEYIGTESGDFKIGGATVRLWHPRGGSGYALSYRIQRWAETATFNQKPHVLLTGHWHSPVHIPAYKNVELFRLPCFQAQTPFEQGKTLFPSVGSAILDLEVSKNGLEDVKVWWRIKRIHIDNDY